MRWSMARVKPLTVMFSLADGDVACMLIRPEAMSL